MFVLDRFVPLGRINSRGRHDFKRKPLGEVFRYLLANRLHDGHRTWRHLGICAAASFGAGAFGDSDPRHSPGTRHVVNRVATALRLGASTLLRSQRPT